jgi:hypothetical protein
MLDYIVRGVVLASAMVSVTGHAVLDDPTPRVVSDPTLGQLMTRP